MALFGYKSLLKVSNALKKDLLALNIKQMEKVIEEGGSVLYKGKVITRIEDLPTNNEGKYMNGEIYELRQKITELKNEILNYEPPEEIKKERKWQKMMKEGKSVVSELLDIDNNEI